MHLELLQKKAIPKTADTTDDLIGNKIADKITRASKASPQNNSEGNIEHDKYIGNHIYLQNSDRELLRFKINIIIICNNGISKNDKLIR